MNVKMLPIAVSLLAIALPGAAYAQGADGPANERVNLVIVYGDDPCPQSDGSDIVVCARKDEGERYRIPEPLRGDPDNPKNEAWGEKVKSIEYVGRSGTDSCTPVGGGGFTGCFNQIARQAKAERKQMGSASYADLVAAERAKRLANIDAESEQIEAQAKAEEAAQAAAKAKADAMNKDLAQPPEDAGGSDDNGPN